MSLPLASVVMPTRNRAGLLPRAIRSVLAQTLAEHELIVVDDASSDDTPVVLAELAAADPRLRTVRLERPIGAAAARNRGISLARGELVAFLDDDDQYLPTKLEIQLEALRAAPPGVGMCYSPCLYVGADGEERVLPTMDVTGLPARGRLLARNFISTPTVLVHRRVLEAAGGFDERLPRFQDWDLWIRLAAVTRFLFVPVPLVRAHLSEVSISTSSAALAAAVRVLDRKFATEMALSRAELADGYHALGHLLMIGGAPREGPGMLWKALRHRPWPPRRAVMALLSVLGPRVYGRVAGLHRRWVEG